MLEGSKRRNALAYFARVTFMKMRKRFTALIFGQHEKKPFAEMATSIFHTLLIFTTLNFLPNLRAGPIS